MCLMNSSRTVAAAMLGRGAGEGGRLNKEGFGSRVGKSLQYLVCGAPFAVSGCVGLVEKTFCCLTRRSWRGHKSYRSDADFFGTRFRCADVFFRRVSNTWSAPLLQGLNHVFLVQLSLRARKPKRAPSFNSVAKPHPVETLIDCLKLRRRELAHE